MNQYFLERSEAAGSGLVVLPGVKELLSALQVPVTELRLEAWFLVPAKFLYELIFVPESLAGNGLGGAARPDGAAGGAAGASHDQWPCELPCV